MHLKQWLFPRRFLWPIWIHVKQVPFTIRCFSFCISVIRPLLTHIHSAKAIQLSIFALQCNGLSIIVVVTVVVCGFNFYAIWRNYILRQLPIGRHCSLTYYGSFRNGDWTVCSNKYHTYCWIACTERSSIFSSQSDEALDCCLVLCQSEDVQMRGDIWPQICILCSQKS